MVNINVKGKEYCVSDEEFKEITKNATKEIIVKEGVGFEQIAVYVGNILVGYVASKILDRFIFGKEDE